MFESGNVGIGVLVPCRNLITSKNNLLPIKRSWWPFVFDVFTMALINLFQRDCAAMSVRKKDKKNVCGQDLFAWQWHSESARKRECAYVCVHTV